MSLKKKLSKLTDKQIQQLRATLEEKKAKQSRLEAQAETIQRRSNSSRGEFSSVWQQGSSQNRAQLDKSLAEEIAAKAELHKTTAIVKEVEYHVKETSTRLERQSEMDTLTHQNRTAAYENETLIAQNATARGLSMQNEAQRQFAELEVEKKDKLDVIEIKTERARSEIKVDEHRDIKEIDLDIHRQETQIDVMAAIVARVPEQFEVELLTQRLFGMYDQRQLLLLETDTQAKRSKMRRLNKNIRELEKAIDGRTQGLIQGNQRPELRGLEEGE